MTVDLKLRFIRIHHVNNSLTNNRTYYNPPLTNDNGHILYREISDEYIMLETEFDLEAKQQYDQAGLAVRLNTDRWIKCVSAASIALSNLNRYVDI